MSYFQIIYVGSLNYQYMSFDERTAFDKYYAHTGFLKQTVLDEMSVYNIY
jgi:hypothetical protein